MGVKICFCYLGVSCGCLRRRKLASGVASLTASLPLGFGVGGWGLKIVFLFACVVRLSASWEARLGVASRTASLLLGFGGLGMGVKICLFFGRVAQLPASWEARLGHRVSDCVVASMV